MYIANHICCFDTICTGGKKVHEISARISINWSCNTSDSLGSQFPREQMSRICCGNFTHTCMNSFENGSGADGLTLLSPERCFSLSLQAAEYLAQSACSSKNKR